MFNDITASIRQFSIIFCAKPIWLEFDTFSTAAINCLRNDLFRDKIQHIVEFGCAEMKLFPFMKNALMDRDLHVKLVDIDEELISRCKGTVQPLIADHLVKRKHDLHVQIWQGDVAAYNPNFVNVDCVICLELIEHLYPNTLEQVPYQIFENLKPKIAVFSTPNCEYNKVFDLEPGHFRHADHKFEWRREQFQDWCDNICERFSDYTVQIEGIGKPPHGHDSEIGCSSQFALFIRKDFLAEVQEQSNGNEKKEEESTLSSPTIQCDNYKLLALIDYPVFRDTRDIIQKLSDEICYQVNRYKFMGDKYYNEQKERTEIPINLIINGCWEITTNENEIKSVIYERYLVENDLVIFENHDDDHESDEQQLEQLEQELEQIKWFF